MALAWTFGDGRGGAEVGIGPVSNATQCATTCSKESKDGAYANGATVSAKPATRCYCEYEQTGIDSNTAWTNTLIRSGKLRYVLK